MAKGSSKKKSDSNAPRIANRKARHDYHIHESFECGIVLRGTEVKAIRNGRCSIAEAFARVEPTSRELWLYNMDIGTYDHAAADRQHEAKTRRKLLVHRRQIANLLTQTMSKGMTLVPLALYFNDRGLAKVELAIASGKGHGDKRETTKKREADREMRRAMTRKRI
ncbi:SsrA-binding protein SmpB [Planctomycetales bacterium ZRK34]|nr:SsrA-binding protein SmpB [Planctomycetales bacterium ZRK34]